MLRPGRATAHEVGDNYDPANPTGCRGNWYELHLRCETCPTISRLVIAFHKGETWLAVFDATGHVPDFDGRDR